MAWDANPQARKRHYQSDYQHCVRMALDYKTIWIVRCKVDDVYDRDAFVIAWFWSEAEARKYAGTGLLAIKEVTI